MHDAESPKYALAEIERRWLVDPGAVPSLVGVPSRLIEDLYVSGTRLRLRRITDADGMVTCKLGKKYGKRTVISEPVTTLYLDEHEHARLLQLPGSRSRKRRYAIAGGSLDLYEEPRAGLMIFELEFAEEEAAMACRPPGFVTREISGDMEYSGFRLSQASRR